MRRATLPAMALLALLAPAGRAVADDYGYEFRLFEGSRFGFNAGEFRLTNLSDTADITAFSISIGDAAYNWDYALQTDASAGVVPTLVGLDEGDGGLRADVIDYDFAGFAPGRFYQFEGDVDLDSVDTIEDFRLVLFDLGGADASDNALLTVTFSNGGVLSTRLPDFPQTADNIFVVSQVVPEPASALLLAPALAAALALRRRIARPAA